MYNYFLKPISAAERIHSELKREQWIAIGWLVQSSLRSIENHFRHKFDSKTGESEFKIVTKFLSRQLPNLPDHRRGKVSRPTYDLCECCINATNTHESYLFIMKPWRGVRRSKQTWKPNKSIRRKLYDTNSYSTKISTTVSKVIFYHHKAIFHSNRQLGKKLTW